MGDRNDRRRDRQSWSEIDKLRSKSHSRDRDPMQKQSSPAAMNAQKSYRAALERAFASGKLDELARTLSRSPDDTAQRGQPPPVSHAPPPASAPPPAPAGGNAEPGAQQAAAPAPPPSPAPAPIKDPDREQRQKLLGKLRDAEGRDAITRAADAFIGKFGKLPDDYELLTKCLGHKNDDRVRETLDRLIVLVARDKPRRTRTLVAQLRFIEDTHGDPEIRAHAGRVRGQL
jgi:hypothetical protein